MATPSNKNSKSHKRMRRGGHSGLNVPNIVFDQVSGEYRVSHRVSPNGFYNGQKVTEK